MSETANSEQILEKESQMMVTKAESIIIHSQQEYESAGQVLVEIKSKIKKVKDYWAGPKSAASKAHKALCDRETEMLRPLSKAESLIKASMSTYQVEMQIAREKAEEAARKARQEEINRQLELSIKAQEEGDEHTADLHMLHAEVLEQQKDVVTTPKPTAMGTSVRRIWKARITDPEKVPAYVNGMEIREIKMSALNSLAKMSEGKLSVPGVEFYLETSISARG